MVYRCTGMHKSTCKYTDVHRCTETHTTPDKEVHTYTHVLKHTHQAMYMHVCRREVKSVPNLYRR